MNKLDKQIKELQLKKKKIELYNTIKSFVMKNKDKEKTTKEINDVKTEIQKEVSKFIDSQISNIENNTDIKVVDNKINSIFCDSEIKILKNVAKRIFNKEKPVITKETNSPVTPNYTKPQTGVSDVQDKFKFAMANRHLDSKKVIVTTVTGPMPGIVVGLDAPHIIVKTQSGATIKAAINNITVEN